MHSETFVCVESHLPVSSPLGQSVEVLLKDLCVTDSVDFTIDVGIICKEAHFGAS